MDISPMMAVYEMREDFYESEPYNYVGANLVSGMREADKTDMFAYAAVFE